MLADAAIPILLLMYHPARPKNFLRTGTIRVYFTDPIHSGAICDVRHVADTMPQ